MKHVYGTTGRAVHAWPCLNGLRLVTLTIVWLIAGGGVAVSGTTPGTVRLSVQMGHRDYSPEAVFSPDGRLVLTFDLYGYEVVLWELATRRELRRFAGSTHLGGVSPFSPDSRRVLTVGRDKVVHWWDIATGQDLGRVDTQTNQGIFAGFSPKDGRFILIGGSQATHLLDAKTGTELYRFAGSHDWGKSTVFSRNERWVLIKGEKTFSLWDTDTGKERHDFANHVKTMQSAAFSHDSRWILTTSDDGTGCLWDINKGKELYRFGSKISPLRASPFFTGHMTATLSPNDRIILLTSESDPMRLLDAPTGREVRRFTADTKGVESAIFSPNGDMVLTTRRDDDSIRIWDAGTGLELPHPGSHTTRVQSAVFSPDNRFILTSTEEHLSLWDIANGRELHRFQGLAQYVDSAVFSSDDRYILAGSTLWDTKIGQEQRRFADFSKATAVFSPDNHFILTAGDSEYRDVERPVAAVRLWDVGTGRALPHFQVFAGMGAGFAVFSPDGTSVLIHRDGERLSLYDRETSGELRNFNGHSQSVTSAVFSPMGGHFILTASEDHTARRWNVKSGKTQAIFQGHTGKVNSAVFSPKDGSQVLTTSEDQTIRLWDKDGHELRRFEGHVGVQRAIFSPNGESVLTSGNGMCLWDSKDLEKGRQRWCVSGDAGRVNSAVFSSSSSIVLTTHGNAMTCVWDAKNGAELLRLFSFTDGTWVVATPDGRFDTNNLETLKGLSWIMPDDPLRTLPVEIFMRDYYEPRLLPRVLAREQLPQVRSLAILNRAQPLVQIVNIARESEVGADGDTVAVTVEVSGASQEFGFESQKRCMETGAYDLRVLRDGQLVDQWPQANSHVPSVGMSEQEKVNHWRQERRVVTLEEGTRQIVFKGIRLPRRAGLSEVEFSAYAFNEDRVKSETVRMTFVIPPELRPRVPRAYVVSVGVNAFEDPKLDLSFAATDATQLGEVLTERLGAQRNEQGHPRYEAVVWVTLTTEAQTDKEGKRHMTKNHANKAQIAGVLKTLAGQPVKAEDLQGIPHAEKLRRANPEDVVIISLSTHGEVDQQGQFYLLPYDIGAKAIEQERRQRAISTDDLSEWLHGLDVIDLVMIVDACYSAASVQNAEFKPGPMGNRGLGQLAYDKGMRILTATQPDKPAYETVQIGMGVLTNALVREGLEQGEADYQPKDQRIWLSEWLSYAVKSELGSKDNQTRKKGTLLTASNEDSGEPLKRQQPGLFDFARNRDVLISVTAR